MRIQSRYLLPLVVPALFATACGSSGTYSVNNCGVLSGNEQQTEVPEGLAINGLVVGGTDIPIISVGPDSKPVTELSVTELLPGDGDSASLGDVITVNYCGVGQSTGKIFDSSWANGEPATFPLVEGGLIQGWIEGVPGMQIGERRLLEIPSELGYGDQAVGSIQPNETLIFVVELVSIAN